MMEKALFEDLKHVLWPVKSLEFTFLKEVCILFDKNTLQIVIFLGNTLH